jgi:NAD(P)-dependent dehydrogenase (short-subunit alcohol dehydrogenase family)
LAGRREERLDELAAEIEGRGGKALPVRTDVSDEGQVGALISAAKERFGSVDILVNNAGVGLTARFEEQPIEDFRRLMEVNFWGVIYACKAAVQIMREQTRGGVIINVSSILGKRGMPFETAYCATKFALAGFSEALRTELVTQNIDVSTIFPGLVETEFAQAMDDRVGLPVPSAPVGLPARELARVIVQDARFPQPEIVMALDAQAINFLNTVAPQALDFFLGQSVPFMGRQTNPGR